MVDEVTTVSWSQRIKNSLIGILVGLGMIFGGIYLLFWNEKNSLNVQQSLAEVEKNLSIVDSNTINPQYEQKPIYLTGTANTEDNLEDKLLNIEVNAINLSRHVEMYQWQEEKVTDSEKQVTHYNYQQVWSSNPINSQAFKEQQNHSNPSQMPISDESQYAKKVNVGEFVLSQELIEKIGNPEPIQINDNNLVSLSKVTSLKPQIINNQIYMGNQPNQPEIGDLRISVSAIYPQKVSIIGMQSHDGIIPYVSSMGESILILSNGEHSAKQMILEEMSNNALMSWIIRIGSLLLLCFGFYLILNPLVVFADVLPIFGSIIAFGSGFISFIAGLSFWSILTAIAWVAIRPLFAIGFLAVISLTTYFLIRRKSNKISAPVTTPEQ